MSENIILQERTFVSQFLHQALPLFTETCLLGLVWSNSDPGSCASLMGLEDGVWLKILEDLGLIRVAEVGQTVDEAMLEVETGDTDDDEGDDDNDWKPKYTVQVLDEKVKSFIADIGLHGAPSSDWYY